MSLLVSLCWPAQAWNIVLSNELEHSGNGTRGVTLQGWRSITALTPTGPEWGLG